MDMLFALIIFIEAYLLYIYLYPVMIWNCVKNSNYYERERYNLFFWRNLFLLGMHSVIYYLIVSVSLTAFGQISLFNVKLRRGKGAFSDFLVQCEVLRELCGPYYHSATYSFYKLCTVQHHIFLLIADSSCMERVWRWRLWL